MSCPPRTPNPCQQVCPPPPPAPPCRVKPIMRGLHWAQTTSIITTTFVLCALGGMALYFFSRAPKLAAYQDYHAKAEIDDWADEMARKGLFKGVPKESLTDNPKK